MVLMDDVIEAVDKLAYQNNTSRSNMINQILAEYCSFVTPEKQMSRIFDEVSELLAAQQRAFQLLARQSDRMMNIKSALSFKYNPTIRYSLELYPDGGNTLGELRVNLRTQSRTLLTCLTQFFLLWKKLEEAYAGEQVPCEIAEGKYRRVLGRPAEKEHQSPEAIAVAISGYITCLDDAMKAYFANLDDLAHLPQRVESVYRAHLPKKIHI